MKVREFLRTVIDPLKLNDQELEAALQASALGEIEIPDAVKEKFNDTFLTLDRAASDDRVLAKARGAVYSMVEQRLAKKVFPKLKEDDQKGFNEAPQLFDKIDYLEKALDNIAAAPAEDVKKVQEKWRQTEAELRGQIKDYEDKLKQKDETAAAQLRDLQLDYALRTKFAGIKFAPEFEDPELKDSIANSTIEHLKRNFVLQIDDKNPSTIHLRRNADGAVVDVYEYEGEKRNDKPFTLDEVVTKKLNKFLPKNTAGGESQSQQPPKKPLTQPSDKPMTLREMQLAKVDAETA